MKNLVKKAVFLLSVLMFFSLATACQGASSVPADYPNRPIVIKTRPAGGANDRTIRVLQPVLSQILGVNVIIENIEGASALSIEEVYFRSEPDGYAFGYAYPNTSISLELLENRRFRTLEIPWIANVTRDRGLLLAVPARSSIYTVEDLLALSAERPVNFAGSGIRTSGEIQSRYFASALQPEFRFTYVPFNTGGEQTAALAGGHVDVGVVGRSADQMVEEGLLRYLCSMTDERQETLPDVPTAEEFTGRPVRILIPQIGLFGPPGLPEEYVTFMREAVNKALEDPAVIEGLMRIGEIAYPMTAEEFNAYILECWDNMNSVKDEMLSM